MDVPRIIGALLGPYLWLLAIAILVGLAKLPIVKGYIGELIVRLLTPLLLDPKVYRPLHNLTLPTPDGTTQVDHVYVSPYGIFALETKNMAGWIFGGEHQAQWTQKFFRKTFRFQNPLRQNFKHVKALEAVLQVPPGSVHSLVTFVGSSSFKTPMPPNVTEGGGFIPYIKTFKVPVFSSDQISTMIARLETARLAPSFASHREHVRNLQTREDPTAERLCPRCGGALVLRTTKRGNSKGQQFWGCSNYPGCKTVQKLS